MLSTSDKHTLAERAWHMEHLQTSLDIYGCFLKYTTVFLHWKHTVIKTILYTWGFFRQEWTAQVIVGKTEHLTQTALNRNHATLCRGTQTNSE